MTPSILLAVAPAAGTDPYPIRDRKPDALSPWLAGVLVAAVYCIPLLAAIRPVTDWDLWWHLRAGQWISEHGWVTTTDPFSTYGADKSWVAYSWLFEVLVYQLHQGLGLGGVLLCRVVLAVAVVAGCHRLVARREPRFLVATFLTGVAALALYPLMSERPWLFTILFSTLTLEVILDLRAGRRGRVFWLLPILYILWANLHIQFVYGFLLLGLGCAAPVIDRLLGRPTQGHAATPGTGCWWRLVALTAACVLATLVNPYHIRLYGVVLEYATQPGPFRVVNELMAMSFREGWDWMALGLTLATAYALGRQRRLSTFEALLFAASAVLCFRARRDLWLIVLSALAILPARSPQRQQGMLHPRPTEHSPVLGRGGAAAVALAVALLGVLLWRCQGLSEERLRQEEATVFPARACDEVIRRGYRGAMYNDFNWGGYLIWRLPRLGVSIDGRTNLHGEERIQRSLNTWSGIKGWQDDSELAAAQLVFADVKLALASLLRKDERFELVYEDDQVALFVPRHPGKQAAGRSSHLPLTAASPLSQRGARTLTVSSGTRGKAYHAPRSGLTLVCGSPGTHHPCLPAGVAQRDGRLGR